jgi:predicted dehydrogenase
MMRIGVFGAAWIAPRAIIEPARALDGAEVVAIAARDLGRAEAFAAEQCIPRAYDSYEQLLADDSVDVVFVALVNSLHTRWSIAALEAGRDVLCEKPLASNAEQAREMVGVAERNSRLLVEAFHWRFHPLADRIIQLSKRIGTLRHANVRAHQYVSPENVRFRLDLAGGVLMDLGCYALHWLRTITAEEPTVLSARAGEGPAGIDVTMEAELSFPSGLRAEVDCSMIDAEASLPGSVSLRVEGAGGVLEVVNPLAPQLGNRITAHLEDGTNIDESIDAAPTYNFQLASFARVVAGQERPVTGGADSIGNMTAIDSIYRAAGLPVRC